MGYGKKWKIPVSKLESLIDNADTNDFCQIEVWNDTNDEIAGCSIWFELSSGWSDWFEEDPPAVDPT